jgi:hypothetical protein
MKGGEKNKAGGKEAGEQKPGKQKRGARHGFSLSMGDHQTGKAGEAPSGKTYQLSKLDNFKRLCDVQRARKNPVFTGFFSTFVFRVKRVRSYFSYRYFFRT